jgi:hypothetical protein
MLDESNHFAPDSMMGVSSAKSKIRSSRVKQFKLRVTLSQAGE